MKWFRTHIQNGSRLALLALAIQLVLSFGHFHSDTARAAGSTVESVQLADGSGHAPDRHPADGCAICAVMAQAAAVVLASPPVLPLLQAAEFVQLATAVAFVHSVAFGGAFQPRAPPLS
ncbi:MAG: DUF2946 domain-containing protein [Tardiphaga sp.]